jgi:hypothetical protein
MHSEKQSVENEKALHSAEERPVESYTLQQPARSHCKGDYAAEDEGQVLYERNNAGNVHYMDICRICASYGYMWICALYGHMWRYVEICALYGYMWI